MVDSELAAVTRMLSEVGEKISSQGDRLTTVEDTVKDHTEQISRKAENETVESNRALVLIHYLCSMLFILYPHVRNGIYSEHFGTSNTLYILVTI